jgi:aminoglycoside phosphotransferase
MGVDDRGATDHHRRVPSDAAATLTAAVPGSDGWTRTRVYRGTSQGAELWSSSSGRRVIVKHHPRAALDVFEAIGRRIQVLRNAGVPAPATRVAAHGEDVLLIHDYLPGRSDPALSAALIDDLIDIIGREAGLADDSAPHWPELIRTSLAIGQRHRTLQRYSQATRGLLERVCRVGHDPSVGQLTARDLVHFDLHTGQLVSDDGRRVSGIIDWDGVRSGDRSLDLANIAFTSLWKTSDAGLHEQIWDAFLSSGTHDSRVVYIHLVALAQVDVVIRQPELDPGFARTLQLAYWALTVTEKDRFSPVPS